MIGCVATRVRKNTAFAPPGRVYKGNVKSEDDEQKAADRRLDDNWQAYRRGGGRGVFKKLP